MSSSNLVFEKVIKSSPADVFRAFTTPLGYQEWLCWQASVMPHPGGPLHLVWANSYFTSGYYLELIPAQKVTFTWFGKGDPAPTTVEVVVREEIGQTRVILTHRDLGSGSEWNPSREEISRGWERNLENLVSVLETGRDLRQVNRPMLGISDINELDSVTASKLGVPVQAGLVVGTPLDGFGAMLAGMKKGDVLVELAGVPINHYAAFHTEMQKHTAGETVPVVVYRGTEKLSLSVSLSHPPIPEPPATAVDLANALRAQTRQADMELEKCFDGVSEEQAAWAPAPGEWSALEVLAHLIQVERDLHTVIQTTLADQIYEWTDNAPARISGTVSIYPTVPALMEVLKQTEDETYAIVADLPDQFVQRKASFWSFAQMMLSITSHTISHIAQIRSALGKTE